jgi:hypothetical protein
MKFSFFLTLLFVVFKPSEKGQQVFVGSTPPHSVLRSFFEVSPTDSIDFIRYQLSVNELNYELKCQYGISKPATPGFVNEKQVHFSGDITKEKNIITLHRDKKILKLLEVNENLLHLLDHNNNMLIGNGGYSFVLNNKKPVESNAFTITAKATAKSYPLVFEGRTPCQELSSLLKLDKTEACDKMKWYIIFYADSLTGKPTYYLNGGTDYRKETMGRGKWSIQTLKDGRIVYQLKPDDKNYTLNLLKGDDNILFFIRPDGRLLVGNENFSYTLNRRNKEYERIK